MNQEGFLLLAVCLFVLMNEGEQEFPSRAS